MIHNHKPANKHDLSLTIICISILHLETEALEELKERMPEPRERLSFTLNSLYDSALLSSEVRSNRRIRRIVRQQSARNPSHRW